MEKYHCTPETENQGALRFVYAADLQPGSPRSFRYRAAWKENWSVARRQIIDARPEFLILGGDITRDGFYNDFELKEMKESLDTMDIPYKAVPGNMDIGNKFSMLAGADKNRDDRLLNVSQQRFEVFETIFGPSNWTFVSGDIRLSGFCDILLGSGLPGEKKVRAFLERLPELPKTGEHFILMHYAMFINSPDEKDYDITREEEYHSWYFGISKAHREYLMDIFKDAGVTRVLTAHIHCRREVVFNDILYDFAPSTTFGQDPAKWTDGDSSPGFYVFEKTATHKWHKKFVPTWPLSDNPDFFGKSGHVNPGDREYSLSKAYLEKKSQNGRRRE